MNSKRLVLIAIIFILLGGLWFLLPWDDWFGPDVPPTPWHPTGTSPTVAPTVLLPATPTTTPRPTATPTETSIPPTETSIPPTETSSPTPTATPEPSATATATAEPEQCRIQPNSLYTIKRGDTLWDIATCAYGDPLRWVDICDWNALSNCNYIHAGNTLVIPPR